MQSPSPERRVLWRAVQGGSTAPAVAWRLLGGNNHELGRSIPAYPSLASAVEAVRFLQLHLDEIESALAPSTVTSRWGWRITLAGAAVAASGRWYQREREARYNLEQFLIAAPTAQVVDSLGSRSRMRPTALSDLARAEVARLEQQALSMQSQRIAGATS